MFKIWQFFTQIYITNMTITFTTNIRNRYRFIASVTLLKSNTNITFFVVLVVSFAISKILVSYKSLNVLFIK